MDPIVEEAKPERRDEALTGEGPMPRVKRFNRKTVTILIATMALVVILAFARSLLRPPPYRFLDPSSAETTAAATDAINGLPSSYADIARASPQASGDTAKLLDTVPIAAPVLPSGESEETKLAARARESGFGFAGTGGASLVERGEGLGRVTSHQSAGVSGDGSGSVRTDRDADNRQDDKLAYLDQDRARRWELNDRLHRPRSPYTLFAGTVIPGVLLTGINSDLPGQIEGQISQNVYDSISGKYLLLPQGTKLLGSYDSRITYGQSRVLVVWTRLIRPDGSNIDLQGMPGVDLSGYAGLTGKVDRHLARLLGAIVLGSVIQAGAESGSSYVDPTFADRLRQGAGAGVNEATQQLVRKELQIQPTIDVRPGARFAVFTTKDVTISSYRLEPRS